MRIMRHQLSLSDKIIANVSRGLRTCFASTQAARPRPARGQHAELSAADAAESIKLMRVNHAGEVSAQALYYGQALVARSDETQKHLENAAQEEHDHLVWCAERLTELGGRTSHLTPLWYAGSFAIGAIAGLSGDQHSLGFVQETEKQVEAHLEDHLQRLSSADSPSRKILEQMAEDEARHGQNAAAAGAIAVSATRQRLMAVGGSILRQVARIL